MIDVEDNKNKIYNLLFVDYAPKKKCSISPVCESIIRNTFNDGVKKMNLQELNFCVSEAIHHIIDYIEMEDPTINMDIARKLATKFVIKATGFENFWQQLEAAGLVNIDNSEWV